MIVQSFLLHLMHGNIKNQTNIIHDNHDDQLIESVRYVEAEYAIW